MPASFWQTQYEETPRGWKSTFVKAKNGKKGYWTVFNHWRQCCRTCQRMIKESQGYIPWTVSQLVLEDEEHTRLIVQKGQAVGLRELDENIARRRPTMIGVHIKFGPEYNNDKTTEHFVVIVGSGIKNGRKYYRFYDVGTLYPAKGTDARNRLYYDASTGLYTGKSCANGKEYTISQIRFR